HQLHEFVVLGEIERRLGQEGKRVGALLLPADYLAEDRLDCLLVADQIVVHNEDNSQSRAAERFKLGQNLLARLEAGPPPESHNDGAELASERTAAGDLQASKHVTIRLEQIDAPQRASRHIASFRLAGTPS